METVRQVEDSKVSGQVTMHADDGKTNRKTTATTVNRRHLTDVNKCNR